MKRNQNLLCSHFRVRHTVKTWKEIVVCILILQYFLKELPFIDHEYIQLRCQKSNNYKILVQNAVCQKQH